MADVMLDGIPIGEATDLALKAAAYDTICMINQGQRELGVLEQELMKRRKAAVQTQSIADDESTREKQED